MTRPFSLLALLTSLALPAVGAQAATPAKVDQVHSQVFFTTTYLGHSHFTGRFNEFSGTVTEGMSVQFEIDMGSVDTSIAKRDKHLRSPDFFNAKQFPKARFNSIAWKKTGDTTWDVTGAFTLKGVTKNLTAKVTKVGTGKDRKGRQRIGYDVTFEFDRHDLKVDYMKGAASATIGIRVQITTIVGG